MPELKMHLGECAHAHLKAVRNAVQGLADPDAPPEVRAAVLDGMGKFAYWVSTGSKKRMIAAANQLVENPPNLMPCLREMACDIGGVIIGEIIKGQYGLKDDAPVVDQVNRDGTWKDGRNEPPSTDLDQEYGDA